MRTTATRAVGGSGETGRRRGRALLTAALAALTVAPLTGCSGPGSGCRPTALEVEPVRVSDPRANLTLHARLTSEGRPLPRARVHFAAALDDGLAVQIGDGRTDARGTASVTQRGGIGPRLMRGDRAVGYEAGFEPWQTKGGVQFCKSEKRAKLSCNGGACGHLDQKIPEP